MLHALPPTDINPLQGAAQSGVESASPVAVCRAAENVADEFITPKLPTGATSESNPPATSAETAATAHEPPPGLGAFDGDNDQDTDDPDEILGSTLAEDSQPVDDLMVAPDDDESPESTSLNAAGVPPSRDEPLEASQLKISVLHSSIPLWLINNYKDLCEHL